MKLITKGKWSADSCATTYDGVTSVFSDNPATDGQRKCIAMFVGSRLDLIPQEERDENARLFVEAGNLANSTGKSPWQIWEEHERMVAILKVIQSQYPVILSNLPDSIKQSIEEFTGMPNPVDSLKKRVEVVHNATYRDGGTKTYSDVNGTVYYVWHSTGKVYDQYPQIDITSSDKAPRNKEAKELDVELVVVDKFSNATSPYHPHKFPLGPEV